MKYSDAKANLRNDNPVFSPAAEATIIGGVNPNTPARVAAQAEFEREFDKAAPSRAGEDAQTVIGSQGEFDQFAHTADPNKVNDEAKLYRQKAASDAGKTVLSNVIPPTGNVRVV